MLLDVSGVTSGYGDVVVVDDCDLAVDRGEMVTVVGPNGAGKSTLLKTVVGLLAVREGAVTFDGDDVTDLSAEEIIYEGICYVPQSDNVFPSLTVRENLRMGAWALADGSFDERAERVYDRFPILRERTDQRVGTMSGGQQQMVSMSRGLMSDPDMLLLDEPTLGLAPDLAADILDAIGRINEAGTTVLLVSQQALSALDIADRAYVLDNGEVTLSGPATELKRSDEVREAYLGM